MRELSGKNLSRRVPASAVLAVVVAVLVGMLGTTAHAAAPAAGDQRAAQAKKAPVLKNEFGKVRSRVVGSFGAAGTVQGTFTPKRFVAVGDGLVAVGRLEADLVRGNGKVVDSVSQKVRMPVATAEGSPLAVPGARATCDILNLVLAPLDLDLLGLQVHLDRVVLDIVAESGAGNLLGNLLCAVTGLLDAGGLLSQVAQILDAILALLRQ